MGEETLRNVPRVNSANVQAGIDEDGCYTVRAGKKGRGYRILPAVPPTPDKIKELREKAGLTQKEFAQVLGVSSTAISSWEKGTKSPDGVASRLLDMMMRDESLIERYLQ